VTLRGIIAILALALSACVNPLAIDPERAEGEARQAIAENDHRLVGVYGFASETPGATFEDRQRLGVRFIEGTGDDFRHLGEVEYNTRAREYAERYNAAILAAND
jgi:hypothetical protein